MTSTITLAAAGGVFLIGAARLVQLSRRRDQDRARELLHVLVLAEVGTLARAAVQTDAVPTWATLFVPSVYRPEWRELPRDVAATAERLRTLGYLELSAPILGHAYAAVSADGADVLAHARGAHSTARSRGAHRARTAAAVAAPSSVPVPRRSVHDAVTDTHTLEA